MKTMLVLTMFALSACSTYGMQCSGALQPINKPTVASGEKKPTPTESRP